MPRIRGRFLLVRQMTNAQVAWAAEHDWYVRSEMDTKTGVSNVVVRGEQPGTRIKFTDFQALRRWAGY